MDHWASEIFRVRTVCVGLLLGELEKIGLQPEAPTAKALKLEFLRKYLRVIMIIIVMSYYSPYVI